MIKRMTSVMLAVIVMLAMCLSTAFADNPDISQSSMTIEIGQTAKLTTGMENAMWISSEPSVASVDQNGNVTGKAKGSTVITVSDSNHSAECVVSVVKGTTAEITRYNVLIIDTSGSIKGEPFRVLKEASKKFARKVLAADGKNYVAVVALNTSSEKVLGFTSSTAKVRKAIDGLEAGGNTNMNAALLSANSLLSDRKDGSNVIKNIILCSDGLPQTGTQSESGRYKKSDHEYYAFANAAYKTDVKSKNAGYFVYALGFFHNSEGNDLIFGKRLMKDLASKDRYYIITKPKDVNKALNNIAAAVTSTTCSRSSVTLYPGKSITLECLVNGVSRKAVWKSANEAVAAVDSSGKVTGIGVGKTTITGTYNGQKCRCTVTVRKKKESASIRLSKSAVTVYVGKKKTLKAIVSGDSSKVTWKSKNNAVATVTDQGVVKGKKPGTVYITATANGKTASCRVRVIIRHPECSQYFMVKTQKASYGGVTKKINEYGVRLVYNNGASIKKCGVYLAKQSDGTFKRTLACKGNNLTYVQYVPYLAYNGKIVFDGLTTSGIRTISLSRDSYGIWSVHGNYTLVKADLKNSDGTQIAIRQKGTSVKNTKKFTNLDKMKTWLNR